MKSLIFSLVLASLSAAWAGGDQGGGSSIVIDKNFKAELLDFSEADDTDLLSRSETDAHIRNRVKNLGRFRSQVTTSFFHEAQKVLVEKSLQYPIFNYLVPTLNFVYVKTSPSNLNGALEQRLDAIINYFGEKFISDGTPEWFGNPEIDRPQLRAARDEGMAIAARFSPARPQQVQLPMAFYLRGVLLVSAVYETELSGDSRVGTATHEALRVLNQVFSVKLTTMEIEVLTRDIFGRASKISDQKDLQIIKAKLDRAYQDVQNKISLNDLQKYADIFKRAKELPGIPSDYPYIFLPGFNRTISAHCFDSCELVLNLLPKKERKAFYKVTSQLGFMDILEILAMADISGFD